MKPGTGIGLAVVAMLPLAAAPLMAEAADERDAPGERVIGTGMASYYGANFAGRRTASGERLSNGAFTAAHRTAPFGSRIRVRNLSNGREVVVRINDRGPWIKGRIIDVSFAAAKAIGLTRTGTARVRLTMVGD